MDNNRVLLIGYVGKHLSIATSKGGSKRLSLRVATHFPGTSGDGKKVYHTTWHDVVAWDNIAEFAENNFVKGSRIMVDGFIKYETYPDHTGHIRYVTLIIAHSLVNLDR